MVEYSLSLSKKSFGDIISLLEKKKYEEQYPAFPKDCTEIFKGRECKQTLQRSALPIADYIFSSYLCSMNPSLPKSFLLSFKSLWIKKNTGKCFGH